MNDHTDATPGAFVERFTLEPTGTGPLDGLTFAIKDIMDVAGRVTGCGNPTWAATHPPAVTHAVCVDQLLAAGATAIGKTVTDQLAFSLLGENYFFGTPVNVRAPDRVPGGSSSGSASAVAAGLCDFALGSDTGGSVRFPASNCGLFGMRPTLGRTCLSGIMPLASTFDTIGVFARDVDVFCRAMSVLLGGDVPDTVTPRVIHFLTEGFDGADDDVRHALAHPVEELRHRFDGQDSSVTQWVGATREPCLLDFADIYRVVMPAEGWSSFGAWLDATQPELGPQMEETIAMARSIDRKQKLPEMISRREELATRLAGALGPTDVICMPTSPTLAPIKGSPIRRDQGQGGYYPRSLSFTGLAGVARLPQISLPLGEANGVPIGLSLIGARNADLWLLALAHQIVLSLGGTR